MKLLTRVDIVTSQGSVLSLPLEDTSFGYIVKDVSGLDPVKATISSSKFAQIDGGTYQASSLDNRNVKLTLGYAPDFVENDIRNLRNYLYRYVMPKSLVTLKFYIDNVLFASVDGVVETCETPLFSSDPEVEISVLCFSPDFVAPESVLVNGSTTATGVETLVTYPGSMPAGVRLRLSVDRALSEFSLHNRSPNGDIQTLEYVGALLAGDVIEIDTFVGAKKAILRRSNNDTSALYRVSPGSTWVQMLPGVNHLRVSATGVAIPYTISYTARHGGL